jgi:outer membrane protein assembly factor BamB
VEWPQWRGPNRDGVVHGVTVPARWPAALTEEWRVPVGEGVASPVVAGGKVYVFTREQGQEIVRCLDLPGGRELWRSEPYPVAYRRGPREGQFSMGPRSTPVVAGGRVFTFGLSGMLSCLDAQTGALLWRKDCQPYPPYGGSSPLVANGLCIVHFGDEKTGGLTAFDVATGEERWCYADGSQPTSVSPVLVEVAGERQVVTFTSWNLLGVSLATGKPLWRHGPFGAGTKIVTPLPYRDLLLVADNMEPLRAVRLEKGARGITAKEVWRAKGQQLNMCTPVLVGDLVFGMSVRQSGSFFCLDAASGATLWQSDGKEPMEHASLLNADGVLLFLTDGGRLLVVRPSARAFEPIAEYRVSDTATFAHPVFLGDRLLIKDATTLRSFRIEPDTPASPLRGQAPPRFLDLQPHATLPLKEGYGRAGNDLAGLPTGEQILGGVKFRIGEGLVLLSGHSTALEKPRQAAGIKVGVPFSRLSMLHATHWDAEDGALVAYYAVNYEGNTRETIPIVFGKDVGNWWYSPGARPPSRARVVWQGANDDAWTTNRSRIRLYLSTWENPHPTRKVVSIDFVSTNVALPVPGAAPFCVALTADG